MLNLESRVVFASRDVLFYESVFPSLEHSHSPPPIDKPCPPEPTSVHNPIDSVSNPNSKPSRQIQKPQWLNDFVCHFL